jgi:threonine dehydrogenase-like Zn-dependent dehydrogenase
MAAEQGALILDERHGDILARLTELTGGRGPDAVIDAVGGTDRPIALRMAIMACRKGGTVSVPGAYGGVVDKFPIGAAFGKGLHLTLGQTHFHRYARPLLERVAARQIDPSFVITHRVTLDDLPDAYQMFAARRDGCVKVIARP